MDDSQNNPQPAAPAFTPAEPPRRRRFGKAGFIAAGVALLAVGGGAGAIAVQSNRPAVEMAPVNPAPIRSLADDSLVTVRGRVAEVYGNKAVIEDGSGRALIELGRAGEDGDLVATGQTVTVQGRFDRGVLRASFLIDAAGTTRGLGPVGRGPHERGKGPRGGPDGPDGPDFRGDAPPPPGFAPQQVPAPQTAPAPVAAPTQSTNTASPAAAEEPSPQGM